MAIDLKRLYRNYQAVRNSKNLGNFALFKADLFGAKANPAIAHLLEPVRGYYPELVAGFVKNGNLNIKQQGQVEIPKRYERAF